MWKSYTVYIFVGRERLKNLKNNIFNMSTKTFSVALNEDDLEYLQSHHYNVSSVTRDLVRDFVSALKCKVE